MVVCGELEMLLALKTTSLSSKILKFCCIFNVELNG